MCTYLCYSAFAAFGGYITGTDVDYSKFLRLGGISFALTLINIVCVYLFALLMFKVRAGVCEPLVVETSHKSLQIKESTPIPGKSELFRLTPIARDLIRAVHHETNDEHSPVSPEVADALAPSPVAPGGMFQPTALKKNPDAKARVEKLGKAFKTAVELLKVGRPKRVLLNSPLHALIPAASRASNISGVKSCS